MKKKIKIGLICLVIIALIFSGWWFLNIQTEKESIPVFESEGFESEGVLIPHDPPYLSHVNCYLKNIDPDFFAYKIIYVKGIKFNEKYYCIINISEVREIPIKISYDVAKNISKEKFDKEKHDLMEKFCKEAASGPYGNCVEDVVYTHPQWDIGNQSWIFSYYIARKPEVVEPVGFERGPKVVVKITYYIDAYSGNITESAIKSYQ